LRKALRSERLFEAKPVTEGHRHAKLSFSNVKPVMRIHECLDVVQHGDDFSLACRNCNEDFGPAIGNYKAAAVYRVVNKDQLTELPPPEGRHSMGAYAEYYCPGCGTMLDVETVCPALEGDEIEPIWDIEISADAIHKAAIRAERRSAEAAA
jgi:acetone carboxylase gamma subunit